jgi:hypothetical protein
LQFHLNNLKTPGLYHILAGETTISSIPANPETQAIHQPFMDLDEFKNLDNVQIFSEKDNFEEAIIEARFGSELWKLCIIFTLIFLSLELLIIKKMEGRVKKPN